MTDEGSPDQSLDASGKIRPSFLPDPDPNTCRGVSHTISTTMIKGHSVVIILFFSYSTALSLKLRHRKSNVLAKPFHNSVTMGLYDIVQLLLLILLLVQLAPTGEEPPLDQYVTHSADTHKATFRISFEK